MLDQRRSIMNILNNIEALIFAVDPGTERIVFANKTFRAMFGEDCIDQPYDRYMPVVLGAGVEDQDEDEDIVVSAEQEAYVTASKQWLALTVDFVPWPDGGHVFFITGFDITTKKMYEESIRNLAFFDYLTGLPNRYRCELDLKEALERCRVQGVTGHLMFIDLDDFKIVNDCYGHDYGDGVLVAFAVFLLELLTQDQDKVYRLGGDEFVIILGDANTEVAQNRMNAMLERAKQPWHSKNREFHCTLSIGVVEFSAGDDVATLLKKADIAMYRAKKLGKNNYAFYVPEFDLENKSRREVESLLRDAVRSDVRGIKVRYQPYSDAKTGMVVGAEALMRLQDASGRLLLPEDFIDLAEYLGLILQLGEQVIRRSATQLKEICDSGLPDFTMTVNLSAKQFKQKDLVPRLHGILRDAGANPRNMVISIREETMIEDLGRANALCDEFHRLGVRVALDDFGAGRVAFMDLRSLGVDIVKVAATHIRSSNDDFAGQFLRLATELCHIAGKTVCVNGVETAEQFAFCRTLGADLVQGFYLNRPATAASLSGLLGKLT